VGIANFYITRNLECIFVKWRDYRRGSDITDAEAFRKIMPLLPIASMVGEDELQERWAVLMESIVTGDSCLPSFGQTLSQLTTEEVQYLDRLWKTVLKPTHYVSAYRFGREPMECYTLLKVFDPDVNPGVNAAERKIFGDLFSDGQKANYERLDHAGLVIEDLVRLGIIVTGQITEQTFPAPYPRSPMSGTSQMLYYQYSFSEYGVSFMQAVTPKVDALDEQTSSL
jgi:hypothetical protein